MDINIIIKETKITVNKEELVKQLLQVTIVIPTCQGLSANTVTIILHYYPLHSLSLLLKQAS